MCLTRLIFLVWFAWTSFPTFWSVEVEIEVTLGQADRPTTQLNENCIAILRYIELPFDFDMHILQVRQQCDALWGNSWNQKGDGLTDVDTVAEKIALCCCQLDGLMGLGSCSLGGSVCALFALFFDVFFCIHFDLCGPVWKVLCLVWFRVTNRRGFIFLAGSCSRTGVGPFLLICNCYHRGSQLHVRRSRTFLAQLHKFHHGHFEVHSFPRMNVLSGRAEQLRSFQLGMSFLNVLNLEKVLAVQCTPTNSCKDYLEKLSSLSWELSQSTAPRYKVLPKACIRYEILMRWYEQMLQCHAHWRWGMPS